MGIFYCLSQPPSKSASLLSSFFFFFFFFWGGGGEQKKRSRCFVVSYCTRIGKEGGGKLFVTCMYVEVL